MPPIFAGGFMAAVKNTPEMRKMCARLVSEYHKNGPFQSTVLEQLHLEGTKESRQQRFYKAVKLGYFVVDPDTPCSNKAARRFVPGPNINSPLNGLKVVDEEMPPLYQFFGMRLPDNFFKPYPNAHIYTTVYEFDDEVVED